MKTLKKVMSKDLHIFAKQGWTSAEVLDYYGLKTMEELLDIIKRVSHSEVSFFKKAFEKNDKMKKRQNAPQKKATKAFDTFAQTEDILMEEAIASKELETPIAVTTNTVACMEFLIKKEQRLSESQFELENSRKQALAKRNEVFTVLKYTKCELEEILEKISSMATKVEELQQQFDEGTEVVEEFNKKIRDTRKELQDVRGKIAQMKKVSIFLYSSGKIEIEGAEKPSIKEEELSRMFEETLNNTEVEALTVGEIKRVCPLLCMVKKYLEKGIEPELYFDSSKLEDYYNSWRAELATIV